MLSVRSHCHEPHGVLWGSSRIGRCIGHYVCKHGHAPFGHPLPRSGPGLWACLLDRRLRQALHPYNEVSHCFCLTPRAQAVGVDSSTKLSPFVALGCTTPRLIHAEVEAVRRRAEEHRQRQGEGQGQGGGAAAEDDVPAPAECDWLDMHLCIRCVPHDPASGPLNRGSG